MEAVAELHGEGRTAAPRCASATLTHYAHLAGDWLPDADRQQLLPLVVPIGKTGPEDEGDAHEELEERRRMILADYCARRFLPLVLQSLGQHALAQPLLELAPIRNRSSAYNFVRHLDALAEHGTGPTGPMCRWMAKGLEPFLDGTSPDPAARVIYAFDCLNRIQPPSKPAILSVVECLRAMVTPVSTRRGWVVGSPA